MTPKDSIKELSNYFTFLLDLLTSSLYFCRIHTHWPPGDASYRTAVLEPIGRYASYFPEINEATRRRNKKLLDYGTAHSKVHTLIEKPSEESTKCPALNMKPTR
ncbi:MAG: hypothetical protein JOS17DRAFT_826716 [Linnemannia elongata]|nr:MAG: hypothetical protein JOS17DRAFT_826716 [Linnemannia elongata]